MAKKSKDAYGASGQTNLLLFEPEALVIVTDPAHPLYDERAKLPIRESMVLNIMHHGVIKAVVVTKDPETGDTVVVDGRQRVRHCVEANRRLRARGEEPLRVSAVVRKFDPADHAGRTDVMVSANEIREDDNPVTKAAKMARLQAMGRDVAHIALMFGVSAQTVRNYLGLLEQPKAVVAAVETGKITISQAHLVADLKPAEQKERVQAMIAAADGKKGHARSAAVRAAVGADGPRMRTRAEITNRFATLPDGTQARKVLEWVLGGGDWE